MTRSAAKKYKNEIIAFINGETIQVKYIHEDENGWMETTDPDWKEGLFDYRIKPKEPEYHPYNPEEIDLSRVLGAKIRHKTTGNLHMIVDLTTAGIFLHHNHYVSWEILFKEYVYLDGTPCGTLEN